MIATIRQVNSLANMLQSQGQAQQSKRISDVVTAMLRDGMQTLEVTDDLYNQMVHAEQYLKSYGGIR